MTENEKMNRVELLLKKIYKTPEPMGLSFYWQKPCTSQGLNVQQTRQMEKPIYFSVIND